MTFILALVAFAVSMSIFSLFLAGLRRAERTQPTHGHEKLGYYSMMYDERIPYSPPQQEEKS